MIDQQALQDYLIQWMEDYGRPLHSTAMECLVEGVAEFVEGDQLTLKEWQEAPRDVANRVVRPHSDAETIELTPGQGEKTRFFYSEYYPHRWTSGPRIHYMDTERGYEPIESLERAREIAQAVPSSRPGTEDYCATSYGVELRPKH